MKVLKLCKWLKFSLSLDCIVCRCPHRIRCRCWWRCEKDGETWNLLDWLGIWRLWWSLWWWTLWWWSLQPISLQQPTLQRILISLSSPIIRLHLRLPIRRLQILRRSWRSWRIWRIWRLLGRLCLQRIRWLTLPFISLLWWVHSLKVSSKLSSRLSHASPCEPCR